MKLAIAALSVLLIATQVQAAPRKILNNANTFDYFAYQTTVSH